MPIEPFANGSIQDLIRSGFILGDRRSAPGWVGGALPENHNTPGTFVIFVNAQIQLGFFSLYTLVTALMALEGVLEPADRLG